jgi:hypothetical protein
VKETMRPVRTTGLLAWLASIAIAAMSILKPTPLVAQVACGAFPTAVPDLSAPDDDKALTDLLLCVRSRLGKEVDPPATVKSALASLRTSLAEQRSPLEVKEKDLHQVLSKPEAGALHRLAILDEFLGSYAPSPCTDLPATIPNLDDPDPEHSLGDALANRFLQCIESLLAKPRSDAEMVKFLEGISSLTIQASQKAAAFDALQLTEEKKKTDDGKRQAAEVAKVAHRYRTVEGYLYAVQKAKGDPLALRIDFYADKRFSNLYRSDSSAFFSQSHTFLTAEIRQLTSRPAREHTDWDNLEIYGLIVAQNDTKADSSKPLDVITTSGRMSFEVGLAWRPVRLGSGHFSFGLVAGVGGAIYSTTQAAPPGSDVASIEADHFGLVQRTAFQLRQEQGPLEGTFSEFGYLHDPTFVHPDRLLARARLVVSPATLGGSSLGAYVDVLGSIGPGQDEVALSIGLRIDALATIKALVGSK